MCRAFFRSADNKKDSEREREKEKETQREGNRDRESVREDKAYDQVLQRNSSTYCFAVRVKTLLSW